MSLRSVAREAWWTAYETVDDFVRDDCVSLSAGLAFYTIFSLAPLIVVILELSGLFLSPELIESQIVARVDDLVGQAGSRQVHEILGTLDARAEGGGGAGLLGLGVTVFAATTVLAQLQTALNRAWGVRPKPGKVSADVLHFLYKRLISLLIVLAITLLLLASLVISTALTAWTTWLSEHLPGSEGSGWLELVDLGVSWVVISFLLAVMFKVLPDATIHWRDVAVGAAVTAILFVLGKELIGLYLAQSAFGSAYGAAGSLAVVLAWVFYSSAILLLGAEFTHVWTRRHGRPVIPEQGAEAIERG